MTTQMDVEIGSQGTPRLASMLCPCCAAAIRSSLPIDLNDTGSEKLERAFRVIKRQPSRPSPAPRALRGNRSKA